MPPSTTAAQLNEIGRATLPGLMGVTVLEIRSGWLRSRFEINPRHLGPNNYLAAGSVISLADISCGYGCAINLPPGGVGFTTIELKANFLGTARAGAVICEASLTHAGRTTQVWDATVSVADTSRSIALFRCTQLVLYSPSSPENAGHPT